MTDDPRCCGTGTCLINAEGICWCGQQWDGEKMGFVPTQNSAAHAAPTVAGAPDSKVSEP